MTPAENKQTGWGWFVATRHRCFMLGMIVQWVFLIVGDLVLMK